MGVDLPPAISALLARTPVFSSDEGESKLPLMLGTIVVILATSTIVKFFHGLKLVSYLPGFRTPFSPYSFLGNIVPATWWNPGLRYLWEGRKEHSLYKYFGSEHFSVTPWIAGTPLIVSSNLDVLRQTAFGSFRSDFEKPEEMNRSLLFWGRNLAGTDGEIWRRHRRIVSPAFNNKLYQHVWTRTAEIYCQMVEAEGWADKDVIDIEAVQRLTLQFTLLVISTCGFGLSFDWKEPPAAPDGSMTVQQALRIVVERSMSVVFLPRLVHKLVPTKYFREIDEAVIQMTNFMKAQVASRKAAVRSGISDSDVVDAFTLMVKANEEEGAKYRLNETELIGNVFVLLFAGHETTAHTLAASMAYLAVNPDIQKDVLDNIISVVGWDGKPTFEDYSKLDKVLAIFLEVLRMYPSGHLLFRKATKDTTLQLPRPVGEEGSDTIPIAKGTMMVIDMIGLQYNPRYFEDPETFKPSRWYGVSNESDAFTAFSIGPRECIGRKFATVEAVSFLTLLIRDWMLEPLLLEGETLDGWKQRVLDARLVITLGLNDASVRLVRRKKGTLP